MSYVGWVPRCAICRKSVNLTVSKADEYGRTVHENCYVSKLLLSWKTTTSLREEASPSRKSAARAGAVATRRSYLAGPRLG